MCMCSVHECNMHVVSTHTHARTVEENDIVIIICTYHER